MERKNIIKSIRLLLLSVCCIIFLFFTATWIYLYSPNIFNKKNDTESYTIYKLNYDTDKLSHNKKNR